MARGEREEGVAGGPKGHLLPHVNSRQLQMLCVTVSSMRNVAPFGSAVFQCECACMCV